MNIEECSIRLYNEIEPICDHIAMWNNKMWLTKEDLKLMPDIVTLLRLAK